jgi:hypothetical protein
MKTRLILLAAAVVTAAIMLSVQVFVLGPRESCEKHGGTWDPPSHSCAQPVSIEPLAPSAPAKR